LNGDRSRGGIGGAGVARVLFLEGSNGGGSDFRFGTLIGGVFLATGGGIVTGGRFREADCLLGASTDGDDDSPCVFRVLYQFLTAAVAEATATKDGFSWSALGKIVFAKFEVESEVFGPGGEFVAVKLLAELSEMLRAGLGVPLMPRALETTSSVRSS
jgi:hypothetical protein